MKIILGPSKTFNLSKPVAELGVRPIFLGEAKNIFQHIKKLSLAETKQVYKLSDKKAAEVFAMHQQHGQKYYYAIEMYNGHVFKQLELEKYNKQWVNEHVVIIDALYGIVKPYDLIAPYRLYFNLKFSFIDLKKFWGSKISDYFIGEKQIINLASKEYSSLIKHELITPNFVGDTMSIKKARGLKLAELILKNQE